MTTQQLKDLLDDQASRPHFDVPDVAALAARGDRVVRRRRMTALVGGVAALALVGGGVAAVVDRSEPGGGLVADAPSPATAEVTWAAGSRLHTPDGAVDLGHEVRTFVRTDAGYVFTDPAGVVWSAVGGDVERVGATSAERARLVSDDETGLAGWVEVVDGRPGFMVLDQATGDVTRYDDATAARDSGPHGARPAYFYAIDGGTAYWLDDRGAVAVDLADGSAEVVDAEASDSTISDVEDGLVASEADGGTLVGRSPGDGVLLRDVYGDLGAFSPDGRWYTVDADEPKVYDVTTGERVQVGPADGFATGYEWLDATHLVMIAQADDSSPVQLLTCRVPDGACDVTVDVLATGFDQLVEQGVQLPVGERIDG